MKTRVHVVMMMMVCLLFFMGKSVIAQSLNDAKQDIYYGHYFDAQNKLKAMTSADDATKSLSKGDAADLERVYYYLGLTQSLEDNKDAARKSFETAKKIADDNKGGIGLADAGLGRIEIQEGNNEKAKQDFQNAWDVSKGRDMEVLRAILEASALSPKENSAFALSLLDKFQDDRKNSKYTFTAEDYTAIGDAYAYLPTGGGKAATNFETALNLDPHYAEAAYNLGNLWSRARQDSLAVMNWEKAVNADSKYAPAMYELYLYYSNRNLDNAMKYLKDYMALADDKLNARQFLVDLLYLQKNYQEAIDSANALLTQPIKEETRTRLYKLIGVSKLRMEDYQGAKESMDTYFKDVKKESILPFDYMTYAEIMGKLGDKEEQLTYLEKYVDADTTTNLAFIRKTAKDLGEEQNYTAAELWYNKLFTTAKPDQLTINDYYDRALSEYRGAISGDVEDDKAVHSLDEFISKYPDQLSGYILKSDLLMRSDTALAGTATDVNKEFIKNIKPEDMSKQTARITRIYSYEANVGIKKEDFQMAMEYADKLLGLNANDPAAANVYGQIALARLKEKNLTEANQYANKALEIDPNNTIAPQVLDYVKQMQDYQKKKAAYDKAKAAQANNP